MLFWSSPKYSFEKKILAIIMGKELIPTVAMLNREMFPRILSSILKDFNDRDGLINKEIFINRVPSEAIIANK